MANLIWRSLGAGAVCAGFYLLTRHLLGPVVWVFLAVVIGFSFSRILIDAIAEWGWQMRRATLHPLAGIHYKFQTFTIHVIEDEDHCRWIATEEVRKVVGQLARDEALAVLFPSGHRRFGQSPKYYLRDDALVAHLSQASTAQAIKFKNWIERNVAFPARKIRQRKGIVIAEPSAARDD